MAQGFSEAEGRRVLVVEDDPARQNTLHKNLHDWNYPVTMCKRAQDALNLIRQEKEEFHILITACNVSDMDSFTFVEQVRRLKPDLPIIILMSRDGDMKKIRKMVELGGCDILWKPMRVNAPAVIPEEDYSSTSNSTAVGKGKEAAAASSHKGKDKQVVDESLVVKKPRLSWTKELHQKFLEAVNMIGWEKTSATKIRAYMNVEGLTREQVASHLQNYRDYMKKSGKKEEVIISAADNDGSGTQSQIGVMTCSNSLAPPHHNLLINQNCIAPVAAASSFPGEVSMPMPMPMPMPMQMQRGGERVGFGHSMSYNQQLMLLQPESTMIPPQSNWNWNWNGGAAAAAAGPSQSHFQPQQWNALSHNPTRDKAGVSSNSLQEYLLNGTSDDDDTMEQELAAADIIFPDFDVKKF